MFRPKVGSAKKILRTTPAHPCSHALSWHCISTRNIQDGVVVVTFLAWHIYLHTFISSVDVLQWTLLCPFSGVKNTHRCVDRGHLDEKSPLCDAVFTSCFSCAVLAFILFTVLRTCPLKPQLSVVAHTPKSSASLH